MPQRVDEVARAVTSVGAEEHLTTAVAVQVVERNPHAGELLARTNMEHSVGAWVGVAVQDLGAVVLDNTQKSGGILALLRKE